MSDTNVNKIPLISKINNTSAAKLVEIPEVGDKFKKIYAVMHGKTNGEQFYEAEKFHFMKTLQEQPKLQNCTKLSLYGCFMDGAVNGLSFDKAAKHMYIVPFNVNAGTQQQPKWESRATLMISGYGELAIRIKQGQVKYVDNPVIVYEGDSFSMGVRPNGDSFVEHTSVIPRKSDVMIACYLKITRNDGSVDFKVMTIDELMKLKAFSKDAKSLAWGPGLPGMFMSKTIKHAFRGYPKIRKGEFSKLQSEDDDADEKRIDYGIDSAEEAAYEMVPENTVPGQKEQPASEHDDDAFAGKNSTASNGVQHKDEDEF